VSVLTKEEQAHVRAALQFLRARCGGWVRAAKALRSNPVTMRHAAAGHVAVSASLTIRVARFVGVTIDDLLAGKFPPDGVCPYCGHGPRG
jgi:hypothetical protein